MISLQYWLIPHFHGVSSKAEKGAATERPKTKFLSEFDSTEFTLLFRLLLLSDIGKSF